VNFDDFIVASQTISQLSKVSFDCGDFMEMSKFYHSATSFEVKDDDCKSDPNDFERFASKFQHHPS